MTTLWFFWPIILAVHVGGSLRRNYISLGVAAALLALPMIGYQRFLASWVLGGRDMVSFTPVALGPYIVGYARGWRDAKQRAGMEPILLEGYGMGGSFTPGAPPFTREAFEKYRLQIESVALCGVTPYIQGHAKAYNTVSVNEIRRRYGSGVITGAQREEAERQEEYASAKTRGSTDAQSDAQSGRLAVLISRGAIDGEDEYRTMFRDRYQTELRRVAKTTNGISETDWRYIHGYNEVAAAELARRFGKEGELAVSWVTRGLSFEDYLRRLEFFRGHGA